MLVRDLKLTGYDRAPKGSSGADRNGNDMGWWKLKNVAYLHAYSFIFVNECINDIFLLCMMLAEI